MNVRAIRVATTLERDDLESMIDAVCELVSEMLNANEVVHDNLISILFTSTPDLVSNFPATAARKLDLGDVPLICAVEVAVPGALARTVRVMAHVNSNRSLKEIKHIYLRGANVLRKDLAQ